MPRNLKYRANGLISSTPRQLIFFKQLQLICLPLFPINQRCLLSSRRVCICLVSGGALDLAMAVGERQIQQLMESITNPDVGTVVVYGIAGLGKTWTARQAYRRAMVSTSARIFDIFIWVSLSATCTARRARHKILENLCIPVEDYNNEERVKEEIHSFLSGSRFLLVIDDAWFTEEDTLDLLGVPTPKHNASKVILTTRTRRTVGSVQPDLVIEQSSLSIKESWDLFCEISGEDSSANRFGHIVVGKSRGMPLLIVLMAGALKVLPSHLANDELAHEVSSALDNEARTAKFAYSMLQGHGVQDCLFYCLLFPGDTAIQIDELIQYWIMDGLVGEGDFTVEVTDKARKILLLLLDHCVLYKEDGDHVRMHDVFRDELLLIGRQRGRIGSITTESAKLPSLWLSEGQHQIISLMESTITRLPENPHYSLLSTLILRGVRCLKVIPRSFFSNMPTLRLLDLSFTSIKYLPLSLYSLVNLQYLLLKHCEHLEELLYISSLEKLEVLDASWSTSLRTIRPGSSAVMNMLKLLDLSHTSIEVFSSDSRFPELRRLCLRGCQGLNFQESKFQELLKLQELDLSNTELADFPYGITKTGHVVSLKLCTESNTIDWKAMQWLQSGLIWHEHAKFYASIRPAEEANRAYMSVSNTNFFQSLDRDSPLWENCFAKFHFRVCPSEEERKDSEFGFQSQDFIFRETYFRTKYFSSSPKHCRFLEIHHIDCCPAGIEGVLNHAEVIFLNDVKSMKQLSDLGMRNLQVIRECWIQRCDRMEGIFNGELEDASEVLSLEKLWISNLEKLSFFCAGVQKVSNISSLRHMHIDCCPNLVDLFCPALRLQNLETLQIRFCDKLESVYEPSVHGEDALPRLHTLRLWELPELKSVCGGILPSIKHLKVKECPKLRTLPVGVNDKTPIAIIRGEKNWWNKLTWEEERIKSHLLFRRWGRF